MARVVGALATMFGNKGWTTDLGSMGTRPGTPGRGRDVATGKERDRVANDRNRRGRRPHHDCDEFRTTASKATSTRTWRPRRVERVRSVWRSASIVWGPMTVVFPDERGTCPPAWDESR